jgi:hypothetical protein
MRGQTACEGHADAQIERVRQRAWVVTARDEGAKETANESCAASRRHVEQQLHARVHSGNARREPVVDFQGSEDEEPCSTAMPNSIHDHRSG